MAERHNSRVKLEAQPSPLVHSNQKRLRVCFSFVGVARIGRSARLAHIVDTVGHTLSLARLHGVRECGPSLFARHHGEPMAPSVLSMQSVASLSIPSQAPNSQCPRRIADWMNYCFSVPVFMTSSELPASVLPHCTSGFFLHGLSQSIMLLLGLSHLFHRSKICINVQLALLPLLLDTRIPRQVHGHPPLRVHHYEPCLFMCFRRPTFCSSSFSWMGRRRTSVNEDFPLRSEVLCCEHQNKGTQ